jgi:hypothetical protein
MIYTVFSVVTTWIGFCGSSSSFADGTLTTATFSKPTGLAFDSSGFLYVADSDNARVRVITPSGGM